MSVARTSAVEVGTPLLRAGRHDLIGIDMAPASRPFRRRTRLAAPVLALVIGTALGLAVLRIDVIRTGYALTETHREEQQLREDLRSLTVSMRRLRAPSILTEHARELGFVRPQHVIELEAHSPSSSPGPDGRLPSGAAVRSEAAGGEATP